MLLMRSRFTTTPSSRRFFTSTNAQKPQKTHSDWDPLDASSLGDLEHQQYLVSLSSLFITDMAENSELGQLCDVVLLW